MDDRELVAEARQFQENWKDEARPRQGTRWRIAILSVLLLLLLATAATAVRYLVTRAPMQTLLPAPRPLLAGLSIPPRYQFSLYGVRGPLGVAVSPDNSRVYVTEGAGARQIVVFDRLGMEVGRFAPPGSQPGGRFPAYIAANGDKVYVTDTLRHSLDMYSADGEYLGAALPPDGAPGWSPLGIGFDRAGNTLVTDAAQGSHRLLVFDALGRVALGVGGEGVQPGQFSFPNGVAADAKRRVYVADGNNGRVQVFDDSGRLVSSIGRLGLPRGLAVDFAERLYVVDATNHTVVVYDVNESRMRLFSFGSHGFDDGQFNYPNGVATDATGRVYVADRENHRVQVWIY
ncbi:MAG: hypothetical protein M1343_14355 [Chloroflexi bacterium]|nr:hypothetical protein [Chloroflexota bacterium]